MLFEKRFHAGLRDGSITLTFRAWSVPKVKPGGRYRSQIGMLEVDALDRIQLGDVSDADARRSGFAGREELTGYLKKKSRKVLRKNSPIYRVALRYAGDVASRDRPPAGDANLSASDVEALTAKLDAMDRRSPHSPWTRAMLAAIEDHPKTAAAKLAPKLGRERLSFKADVRKLKRLGLTISHEVGYEISPRGRAYLDAARPPRRR